MGSRRSSCSFGESVVALGVGVGNRYVLTTHDTTLIRPAPRMEQQRRRHAHAHQAPPPQMAVEYYMAADSPYHYQPEVRPSCHALLCFAFLCSSDPERTGYPQHYRATTPAASPGPGRGMGTRRSTSRVRWCMGSRHRRPWRRGATRIIITTTSPSKGSSRSTGSSRSSHRSSSHGSRNTGKGRGLRRFVLCFWDDPLTPLFFKGVFTHSDDSLVGR